MTKAGCEGIIKVPTREGKMGCGCCKPVKKAAKKKVAKKKK